MIYRSLSSPRMVDEQVDQERRMGIADEIARIREQLQKLEATHVKIALFGQPGAGKSSLINAMVGHPVAKVGVSTDTTTDAAKYEHDGLDFWDLPGYGTERFPADRFWSQFDIPSFDLFLCVFDGKYHQADQEFLRRLVKDGKTVVLVRQKKDVLWQEGATVEALEDEIRKDAQRASGVLDISVFFVSTKTAAGMSDLQEAIYAKLGAAKAERWARSSKAYSQKALKAKREACRKWVYSSAAAAAANALNPIPGLDIAVDLGLLVNLAAQIRATYGLEDSKIRAMEAVAPAVVPVINKLVKVATKEGLLLLFKQFAKREAVKEVAKYIPFVGQIIAAGIGYQVTIKVGDQVLESCHEAAQRMLEVLLAQKP